MIFKHCEKCLFPFELSFVLWGCISNLVFSNIRTPSSIHCYNEDDEKFTRSCSLGDGCWCWWCFVKDSVDSLDDARNKWILPWPPASNQLIMRFYTTTDDSWRLWNLFSKVLWTNFSASIARHHSSRDFSSIIINLRFRSSFSSFSNAKPTLVSP